MNYRIAVSGASRTKHCCDNIKEISKEVGREIARQKGVLVTGATRGVPYFSSQGYKEVGGLSIGFSPAASRLDHVKTYKLPTDTFDLIVYTGSDYAGRNILMTKAVDAMVIICGRMGTLHEFLTALQIKKPIGVLEKTGGTADKIKYILEGPMREKKRIIYDDDPKKLIEKLIKLIKKQG